MKAPHRALRVAVPGNPRRKHPSPLRPRKKNRLRLHPWSKKKLPPSAKKNRLNRVTMKGRAGTANRVGNPKNPCRNPARKNTTTEARA
jgi:hypothetical protein